MIDAPPPHPAWRVAPPGPPPPVPQAVPRDAGFWRRYGAALIDILVGYITLEIAVAIFAPGAASNNATDAETAAAGLVFLVVLTLWINYFVFTEWRWGRTLGKLVTGTAVMRDDGSRPSWNRCLVRTLFRPVDLFAGLVMIPGTGRTVGDRVAGTMVVRRRPPPAVPAHGALPAIHWGPAIVAAGIGIWLLATLIEGVAVGLVEAVTNASPHHGSNLSLAAGDVLQGFVGVTLIGVAVGMATVGKQRASAEGTSALAALGLRRPVRPAVGPAFLAIVAYVVVVLLLNLIIHPSQKDVAEDLGVHASTIAAVVAGFLVVILAPVSEEMFFRGFMFAGFRRRMPWFVAAVLSSVLWASLHLTTSNAAAALQLAAFGIILATLYERTGSIYPTIALHMLNNALAFAVLASQ